MTCKRYDTSCEGVELEIGHVKRMTNQVHPWFASIGPAPTELRGIKLHTFTESTEREKTAVGARPDWLQ